MPLTLSPHDLMAYIQMNDLPCEQDLFCEAIFMLDNDFIDEHRKMSERRTAVQGSKKRPS